MFSSSEKGWCGNLTLGDSSKLSKGEKDHSNQWFLKANKIKWLAIILFYVCENEPRLAYLEPNDDGCGEVEFASSCDDSLRDDVTAHDAAEDVHQNGVHLKKGLSILHTEFIKIKTSEKEATGQVNIT